MSKEKGVRILLISGVRILKWIRMQDLNVSVESGMMGTGKIRILSIKGGEAHFGGGNRIEIKMPGCSRFLTAFLREKVLKIEFLDGTLLKQNYFCCVKCGKNSGVINSHMPSRKLMGREDCVIGCSECHDLWERTI